MLALMKFGVINLKPLIRIHNVETGEIIDREMTAAEFKQYQIDQEIQIEADKKIIQRQEIAERLGLSVDELKVLLG